MRPETIILSNEEIRGVLTLDVAIDAVTKVMKAHGRGEVIRPDLLHADAPRGEFHIKTGGVLSAQGDGGVFGLKANGGFFENGARGLPNIVGVIYLADAETGCPLAVLDSVEISRVRTGAATAVAARVLARQDSEVLTVVGTGTQARTQIEALMAVLPIKKVRLVGRDRDRTVERAALFERLLGVAVAPYRSVDVAARDSDVVVTCTPSRAPLLGDVSPGTFIAAVGADSPGKQELDPQLVLRCTAVADVHDQCVRVGELQHAIGQGLMSAQDVHAEIGSVLTEGAVGRTREDEITLYDSTGTALQDVALGHVIYQQAVASGIGLRVQLGE